VSFAPVPRAALLVALAAAACAHPAAAGPLPTQPLPRPEPAVTVPSDTVSIEETTQGALGTVDVGVANVWERDYIDGSGAARTGVTARLMWDGGSLVVGAGSVFELGGARWEVLRVDKAPEANGHVRLRALPSP